jgi:hypothetical protein
MIHDTRHEFLLYLSHKNPENSGQVRADPKISTNRLIRKATNRFRGADHEVPGLVEMLYNAPHADRSGAPAIGACA